MTDNFTPPPPPNTINTANEGRFCLNVDSPFGERAQSTVLKRAPPRRPAWPHGDFIFNLSMRESKATSVVVCLHAGGRKNFRLVVSSSVDHCCQHFWVGWGPNRIKGGLRRGKCQRDKQAVQIFLGRLQLDDADVVVYKGSKTPRPCCRAVERACFGCARSVTLVTSINMAGVACKCGVGSLVHHRDFDRSHSDAAVLCAGVLSVRQDLRNNQTKAGYPEGFGRAFQPFVLLLWTYLRRGSTCNSPLSKQASRQEPINYAHVNPRDSISGFLQSRLTNNEQKNWTNEVPQQGFGQQRAALPNKLRRYARMYTCNPCPVLEHMAQTHAWRLTIFICWAISSAQVLSVMIILTLPRRESFWYPLCQRENLLEAKPVDVRLRRNEGREGKGFSDLVRRKQRLVTAKQVSLLRSDSFVRCSWKGAQTSCDQQTTQEAKKKMLPRTWRRLFGLMRESWPAPRWWHAAPQPAMAADLKEHMHHTSWTFLFSARIKDPIWSHSNETDLHLRF